MHNANIPDHTELPSNKKLIKSTIIAVVSAVIILVTIAEEEATPNELPISDQQRSETMSVTLGAGESTEIKITMQKNSSVDFNWSSNAAPPFYDLHGDSKDISYHIYEKGTAASKQGTLIAAFDGNHGWYWKNRSNTPITITLTATGSYQDIKEMN